MRGLSVCILFSVFYATFPLGCTLQVLSKAPAPHGQAPLLAVSASATRHSLLSSEKTHLPLASFPACAPSRREVAAVNHFLVQPPSCALVSVL